MLVCEAPIAGSEVLDNRGSNRFPLRRSMAARAIRFIEDQRHPAARIDMVCLDFSASGMRAAYSGTPPQVNDLIEVAVGGTAEQPRTILARVRRLQGFPFRRWEIGIEFLAEGSDDRRILLGLRDEAAGLT